MRARGPIVALLALAPLAAGARSNPFAVSGALGGGYFRQGIGGPQGDTAGTMLDWAANLQLSGGGFSPAMLQWSAGANYFASRWAYQRATSVGDAIGYQATAVAFGGSPLPVTVSAGRVYTSIAEEAGPIRHLGNSRTTMYGGSTTIGGQRYPVVHVGLSRSEVESEAGNGSLNRLNSTGLSLNASQATPTHEYAVGYDTASNDGAYADSNFRSHDVSLVVTAPLSETARFVLNERYFMRQPSLTAASNPRYDLNTLGAALQLRPATGPSSAVSYSYNHFLLGENEPGVTRLRQESHALGYAAYFQVSPRLAVTGTAAATAASASRADAVGRGLAQTLGGGLQWKGLIGAWDVMGAASGLAGLVEPGAGGLDSTHGLGGSAGLGRGTTTRRGGLFYSLAYSSGGAAVHGWTVTQAARGELEWLAGEWLLRGTLAAGGSRRDDALLGSFLGRRTVLTVTANHRQDYAQLSGGIIDGVDGALSAPGSDGLFLPAAYNTHSRYLALTGGLAFDGGRTTLGGIARVGSTTSPGRPDLAEWGVGVTGGYAIGRVLLTAEARYSYGGAGGVWQSGSVLMVRLVRQFGVVF